MKVVLELEDGGTVIRELADPPPALRVPFVVNGTVPYVLRAFRFERYLLGPLPDRNLEAAIYREVPA